MTSLEKSEFSRMKSESIADTTTSTRSSKTSKASSESKTRTNKAPDSSLQYLLQTPPALHKAPFKPILTTPTSLLSNHIQSENLERPTSRSISASITSTNNRAIPPSTPDTSKHTPSQPIQIPSLAATPQHPDRVPTPVSGRGDRKGHLFPFTRSPSPRGRHFSAGSNHFEHNNEFVRSPPSRRSSSSYLSRSHFTSNMYSDQLSSRYTPTSPLSPRMVPEARPISPQPSRHVKHSRQTSRSLKANLPRYHPANFQHTLEIPTSAPHAPAVAYQRHTQSTQMDSTRIMRERQRELIDRVRMSSKIAALPMDIKPTRPRLDPLGSPTGNVTPLVLEEAQDYFQVVGAGRVSPAQSPGAVSASSAKDTGDEQSKRSPRSQSEFFR